MLFCQLLKLLKNDFIFFLIPMLNIFPNGLTRQFKSINPLPTGIYYITITQEGKSVTKKWIVQ